MKHCKYILPVLAVAAALTACNNTEDLIFEGSASERLDAAKEEYTKMLADKGGKWKMEYFSNGDEPGYIIGMQFGNDGSVNVCANHKWIGSTYQEERSSWTILTDDGPVLSYDTYNNLFHIFADPANITGPDAPTNPDRDNEDVNESGYGHNGDYEFVLMETSADGDSIRLKGKKRGITHWLVRLPEDTDMESYLTETTQKASGIFDSRFNRLYLTDNDGERYILKDAFKGVMSAFPEKGDSIMQTVKKNAIITENAIRFMDKFSIPRADDDADRLEVEKFALQPDGTLLSPEGYTITGPTPVEAISDRSKEWDVNIESLSGNLKDLFDKTAKAFIAWDSKRDLRGITFTHYKSGTVWYATIHFQIGTGRARFYVRYNESEGSELSMEYITRSNDATTYINKVPELNELFVALSTAKYHLSVSNLLCPTIINFVDSSDENTSFTVNLK